MSPHCYPDNVMCLQLQWTTPEVELLLCSPRLFQLPLGVILSLSDGIKEELQERERLRETGKLRGS